MKRVIIITSISIAVIVLAIVGWLWQTGYFSWQSNTLAEYNLSFDYPNTFESLPLSSADVDDQVLVRLVNDADLISEPVLVTFRVETGLRTAAALTRQGLTDMILGNLSKAYPKRYNDYKSISERRFDREGHTAAEVIFTYTGVDGTLVQQRFMIIELDGDRVMYVAAQSRASDYSKMNKRYFDRLFDSVTFEKK